MSRITQILKGKKVKPLTELESAVKYAVDHAGGGGGLPPVTSTDNGLFLGVVNGKWAKNDARGIRWITFSVTIDPQTGEMAATTTENFATVFAIAKNTGVLVIANVTVPNGVTCVAPLTAKSFEEGHEWLVFGTTAKLDDNKKPTFYEIVWDESGADMSRTELT